LKANIDIHKRRITVATYNVHCCLGNDDLCDPHRILQALQATDAHVIGLQQVKGDDHRINGRDQAQFLAEKLDMELAAGSSVRRKKGADGTAILSRLPVEGIYDLDITVRGFQPRSCLFVTLRGSLGNILVCNTHLGANRLERKLQARLIHNSITKMVKSIHRLIFLGDFNDWGTRSQVHQLFKHNLRLATTGALGFPLRSYPTYLPLFALDRVYCGTGFSVIRSFIPKNFVTRMASDHYPVVAELRPPVRAKVEKPR
jgi:endonuclease/exonuclease/phosphatase family metal-dependent hydrolase